MMFGLGFWEIVVIFIVAIVFINPKDLPQIARKVGRWYRKMKDFTGRVSKEFKDIEGEISGASDESLSGSFTSTVEDMSKELKNSVDSLNAFHKLPKLNNIMPSFGKITGAEEEKTDSAPVTNIQNKKTGGDHDRND